MMVSMHAAATEEEVAPERALDLARWTGKAA